jgi:hypothetical protein
MPIVQFKGRVLPESSNLTIQNIPQLHMIEPARIDLPNGLSMSFTITIADAVIDVRCDTNPFDQPWHMSWVHNRTLSVLRALIDLHSFATGDVLGLILDSYIDPEGREIRLRVSNPSLARFCTVFGSNITGVVIGPMLNLVMAEPDIFLAMRDLINGAACVNCTAVDCARAVEGLREIMGGNSDRRQSWIIMRDNLQVSQRYLSFITDISTSPRHGGRSYIPETTIQEILERSWTIMNRFLEFRRGGSQPLPLAEFPLLDG